MIANLCSANRILTSDFYSPRHQNPIAMDASALPKTLEARFQSHPPAKYEANLATEERVGHVSHARAEEAQLQIF